MKTVYKKGAWDLLHAGHLNVIHVAANLGDFLVVGVCTDEYVEQYKGRPPVVGFHDRMRLMAELRSVDAVVPDDAPDDMRPIELFGVDIRVVDEHYAVGDTPHAKRQREAKRKQEMMGVQFVIVPRTPGISSTRIKEQVNEK